MRKGLKTGGRAGHAHGMSAGKQAIKRITERLGGGEEGKPHSTKAGRIAAGARKIKRLFGKPRPQRPSWKPHGGVGGPMMKAEGGRIGLKHGSKPWGTGPKPGSEEYWMQQVHKPRKRKARGSLVKPVWRKREKMGKFDRKVPWRDKKTHDKDVPTMAAEGGRIGLKEGGNGKWIQKATKGMVKTKPCTGKKFGSKTCPPGSRRYNLAKTFKKMGRARKAKA